MKETKTDTKNKKNIEPTYQNLRNFVPLSDIEVIKKERPATFEGTIFNFEDGTTLVSNKFYSPDSKMQLTKTEEVLKFYEAILKDIEIRALTIEYSGETRENDFKIINSFINNFKEHIEYKFINFNHGKNFSFTLKFNQENLNDVLELMSNFVGDDNLDYLRKQVEEHTLENNEIKTLYEKILLSIKNILYLSNVTELEDLLRMHELAHTITSKYVKVFEKDNYTRNTFVLDEMISIFHELRSITVGKDVEHNVKINKLWLFIRLATITSRLNKKVITVDNGKSTIQVYPVEEFIKDITKGNYWDADVLNDVSEHEFAVITLIFGKENFDSSDSDKMFTENFMLNEEILLNRIEEIFNNPDLFLETLDDEFLSLIYKKIENLMNKALAK